MKLKQILPLLFLLITCGTFAQDIAPSAGPIHIEGQLIGAENQMVYLLNKNMGGLQSPVVVSNADGDGKFSMDTTIAVRDYYFLRTENGQLLNLVLRPNDKLTINGDCKNLLVTSTIIGSEHSVLLNGFLKEYQDFKKVEDSLKMVLRQNPQKQAEVNAFFGPIAQEFYAYRNNFVNSNQASPALIGTLNAINQDKEWQAYKQVVTLLTYSFGESPTVQNVGKYIFQKEQQLKAQEAAAARKAALFTPGTEVADIVMPDTTGTMIKLSDLRGKVVLIDFWASWCGPCRRENPNVVAAYKKYNADGFEVFSVSLDKKGAKQKWVDAINKDGLVWPYHVSSLEGFATKAAQDYAINSIPFTVLIDEEGKVIATNLRGPRLESELKRIFGH